MTSTSLTLNFIKPLRHSHPLIKIPNNSLIDLPAPINISYLWNWGSLVGFCIITQILTGIFLAIHYSPNTDLAFSSIAHICRDVHYGWLLRNLHANSASIIFMCLYIHIGRGIYYTSYVFSPVWLTGIILFLLSILTGFMGYVLVWGQISFWGATVITNLLSAIPYTGASLVQWVWGGFSVGDPTLNRFFVLHFITPFLLIALSMVHLLFLHQTGSNNPLGLNGELTKIPFHPYYTSKDLLGFLLLVLLLASLTLFYPNLLTDPENFIPANPLITPEHIQPEWYFLFAYAILRSIPNKLGGVVALVASILLTLGSLLFTYLPKLRALTYYPFNQILFWSLIAIFIILTWIGANPVEYPYELVGATSTLIFFIYFLLFSLLEKLWDLLIFLPD